MEWMVGPKNNMAMKGYQGDNAKCPFEIGCVVHCGFACGIEVSPCDGLSWCGVYEGP